MGQEDESHRRHNPARKQESEFSVAKEREALA